jgi:hypothetical protein
MIDMTNIVPNKYQSMDVDDHNLPHIFHMMYQYNSMDNGMLQLLVLHQQNHHEQQHLK